MKKNFGFSTILSVLAFLAMTVALPSHAALISFSATIDEAQANAGAGTGSPATGSATMFLDDLTNEFTWDVSWSGFLNTVTVAHFHGPAAAGSNAGAQIEIDINFNPSTGSAFLDATQASDLLADLWYINIHTDQNPGGEIRGQVLRSAIVPEPGTSSLLLASLAGLLYLRRKRQ